MSDTPVKLAYDEIVRLVDDSYSHRSKVEFPRWYRFIPGFTRRLIYVSARWEHNAEYAAYLDCAQELEKQFPGLGSVVRR